MKSKLSHSQHEGGIKHLAVGISLMLSIHGENTAGGPIVKEKNIVLRALSDLPEDLSHWWWWLSWKLTGVKNFFLAETVSWIAV